VYIGSEAGSYFRPISLSSRLESNKGEDTYLSLAALLVLLDFCLHFRDGQVALLVCNVHRIVRVLLRLRRVWCLVCVREIYIDRYMCIERERERERERETERERESERDRQIDRQSGRERFARSRSSFATFTVLFASCFACG